MSKLNDIVQNPELEEHLMFYVGVKHMHAHWERHLDPWLPIEWEVTPHYYQVMRDSLYTDLRRVLKNSVGLSFEDPDFETTVQEAIQMVVLKHGMDAILETAREMLRLLQNVEVDEKNIEAVFAAPNLECSKCRRQAIPLGIEDLPASLLNESHLKYAVLIGYCTHCRHYFPD